MIALAILPATVFSAGDYSTSLSSSGEQSGDYATASKAKQSSHGGFRLRWDADVNYLYDDNVGQTPKDLGSEILDDSSVIVSVGASYREVLGLRSRINYRFKAETEQFATFTKLSSYLGQAEVTYQYKPSAAFSAPNYSAFVQMGLLESQSAIRSSTLFNVGGLIQNRLTDRIALVGQYTFKLRDSDGLTYDTVNNSYVINLDYLLGQHSTLYYAFNAAVGDITASGNPSLEVANALDEVEADDAFGGAAANQFAYRFAGSALVNTFGYNLSLGKKAAVDVSWRVINSETDDGSVAYQRNQLLVSYLRRF